MLLYVVVCLSPDVVGLVGDDGGDGVGRFAEAAHFEFWWSGDVGGESDGIAAEAIHIEWSLVPVEVILSWGVLSTCFSQKSLP